MFFIFIFILFWGTILCNQIRDKNIFILLELTWLRINNKKRENTKGPVECGL